MKTKTFIAPFIIGLLIAVVIAVGCKDEAEAYEPEEPRGITFDEPIGESIFFSDPNGGITISMASEIEVIEPNEIILWEGWEPNYPITFTFSSENIGSVNFEIGDNNEIICNGTREKWLRITYEAISGKEPTEKVTLRFSEPNEPECKGHGVNAIYCPDCHSLDYLLEPEFELVLNNTIKDKFFEPNEPVDLTVDFIDISKTVAECKK